MVIETVPTKHCVKSLKYRICGFSTGNILSCVHTADSFGIKSTIVFIILFTKCQMAMLFDKSSFYLPPWQLLYEMPFLFGHVRALVSGCSSGTVRANVSLNQQFQDRHWNIAAVQWSNSWLEYIKTGCIETLTDTTHYSWPSLLAKIPNNFRNQSLHAIQTKVQFRLEQVKAWIVLFMSTNSQTDTKLICFTLAFPLTYPMSYIPVLNSTQSFSIFFL